MYINCDDHHYDLSFLKWYSEIFSFALLAPDLLYNLHIYEPMYFLSLNPNSYFLFVSNKTFSAIF